MASPSRLRLLIRVLAGIGGAIAVLGSVLLYAPTASPWLWLCLAGGVLALGAAALPWPEMQAAPPAPSSVAAPARAAAAPARPAAVKSNGDELIELRSQIEQHKALETELLAAKQAAEAAMMAKGEFLATMSHEIRTPLNGIIPLLDILLSSPLGPDQRDYVQTAYASARQLLRIVDDILDYSKLEANKLDLETVGLNLKEVLEGVLRLMEKSAEAKGLSLTLNIDPAVRLAVRGDPIRLRQVLTNLVSNAVKFTERGSVAINVSRRGETRSHHELRFEVRDTGVGIAPEAASKLFQPFSQADASTTRTFGGTGLGLVICKRIVDLMGGQIGVDSELGKGSVFWFQVPMLKAVGDMGSARHHGLQGARALVLTSDPAQLRRFSVALPLWGATPVPASTTQEALNKLRASTARSESWGFQLLLVDLPSVRTTAVALHRNLLREPGMDELKIVYLQGDEPPPAEIVANERIAILARASADAELRQQIAKLLDDAGASTTPGAGQHPAIRVGEVLSEPPPSIEGGLSGHVLLVEDNPVNRQVATRLLSLSGLTLDSAENGKEALDKLAAGQYAAVLMDCQMPIMDGYTATRQRRQWEQRDGLPRMPIIAMTANAMVGDREKCLEAGMDDYLSKPLNRGLLEQTLRRWLKPGTPATRPVPAPAQAASPAGAPTAPKPAAPVAATSQAAPAVQAAAAPSPALTPAAATIPRASPKGPPINQEIVDDLRDIMGAEFASLVRVFLEDAPRSLERLQAAAANNDIDALVGPAHSLKSTSANLGAMELSAMAKYIEHGARQKTLSEAAARVAALRQEFVRVDQALRALLG